MFRSLLVPVDGSIHARKALRIACRLISPNLGILYLLNVQDPSSFLPDMTVNDIQASRRNILVRRSEKAGREILEKAMDTMPPHQGEVHTLVGLGPPSIVIVEEAKRLGVIAIVMGSRGISDCRGLLVGSVSHRVSHTAECMVINVHEPVVGSAVA
ncbi:universal stress protein [Salinicola sp. V024]|uniref:universal stress protein n=1 Tax=Salinicola sp. V024 TaxID=3459609 RepID=UPI004043B220